MRTTSAIHPPVCCWSRTGTVSPRSPPGAPAELASLSSRGPGHGSARSGDRRYLTYTNVRNDGVRFVALYDLSAHHDEELRLVWTSLVAGVVGILLAAGAGLVIGRRAVRP